MRTLILVGFAFLAVCAEGNAAAFSSFPIGSTRAVIVLQVPSMGATDDDARRLYDAIDLEPNPSFLGPAKTIETADKLLSLVCAIRSGGVYTCTIVLQAGAHCRISSPNKIAEFHLTGESAKELGLLFKPNNEDKYEYMTDDQQFKINAGPKDFLLSFGQ